MATRSSTVAWRIPWTEEPGGLQSMGSPRVGHDRATWLHFPLNKSARWLGAGRAGCLNKALILQLDRGTPRYMTPLIPEQWRLWISAPQSGFQLLNRSICQPIWGKKARPMRLSSGHRERTCPALTSLSKPRGSPCPSGWDVPSSIARHIAELGQQLFSSGELLHGVF